MAANMPNQDTSQPGFHVDSTKLFVKEVHAPIRCLYLHLHNSIRAELEQLNAEVHLLEKNLVTNDSTASLLQLRERYQLLVQVNRYHASVEDEVCFRSTYRFRFHTQLREKVISLHHHHVNGRCADCISCTRV